MKSLVKYADNRRDDSLSHRLRQRRFQQFRRLVDPLPRPLRILDVGGTETFWHQAGYLDDEISIVLLNLERSEVQDPRLTSIAGDARDLSSFADNEFDLVFSNSVIEHVGSFEDQKRMADEVRRVGRRYFVQTPNRRFPIEPHFLFPMFQYLPVRARVWLLTHFAIGWNDRFEDVELARRVVESVGLLNKREFLRLFPGATLYSERVLGLCKSFIAYGGFDTSAPSR